MCREGVIRRVRVHRSSERVDGGCRQEQLERSQRDIASKKEEIEALDSNLKLRTSSPVPAPKPQTLFRKPWLIMICHHHDLSRIDGIDIACSCQCCHVFAKARDLTHVNNSHGPND
jgi:hypothetical protein